VGMNGEMRGSAAPPYRHPGQADRRAARPGTRTASSREGTADDTIQG
jgi:hypothetical protein